MSPTKPHKANWTNMQIRKRKLKQKAPHEEQTRCHTCAEKWSPMERSAKGKQRGASAF